MQWELESERTWEEALLHHCRLLRRQPCEGSWWWKTETSVLGLAPWDTSWVALGKPVAFSVVHFILLSNGDSHTFSPYLTGALQDQRWWQMYEKHVEKYNTLCKCEGLSSLRLEFPSSWAGLPWNKATYAKNLAHTCHTVGRQALGAVPGFCLCLAFHLESPKSSPPIFTPLSPSTPLLSQHLVIPQSLGRSEVLLLLFLHSFLHLIVAVCLFLWSCLPWLPLKCNLCDSRDLVVLPA